MNRKFDHRNLAMLLLEARETLMGRFRPILKEFALTEQQWRIIRVLDGEPSHELEAGQIAKRCCILSPSLTGVLERMERDGLIRRTRAQEDQRRLIVSLTPQSRQLVTQIGPRIDEQYRLLEQRFGADALREVYAALDKLIEVGGS
ncbi:MULTISPECIES: homoprotocatechuate degradation operon regulator HpaR [Burkholderia]|uniref:Homoprotocatechuate degradation operon regulator HpaR n=2 Tax=Burkholderia humptydooensis TaxID=430531 RepID=A0A7U4PAR1_9BURK|nr:MULTISPECIES: homoprotocatechuate degradation operon regulator HpaR [Burkholderia]AGK50541.1 homoprotocatechuate degradation operon regulator, HpaR [Burkholderia thailandensis MSMB121]ATF33079.1 homoprotocatechuate degradation operon regulator HpaR [Burkholderia thailandensis]AJY40444.1 homoprotocatechuate degradation operon regulator, HpaR [Burkholderia sp. 2002721687]ALX46099.1 MarR family transcriptional regulator [Burkholderia humptydooensis]KST70743.1 MarR family transcriptional regula